MSDSEGDFDDIETGVSSVLLGFSGKEASKGELNVLGNHIGGEPIWFQNKGPDHALTICKVCEKDLDLLAQLSCPLPDKDYDRALYIFTCSDPNCRRKKGSIRAIKGVESNDQVKKRIMAELAEEEPQNNLVPTSGNLGDLLFGSSSKLKIPEPVPTAPIVQKEPKQQMSYAKKLSQYKKRDFTYVKGKYGCRILLVEEEYFDQKNEDQKYSNVKIDTEEPADDPENQSSNTDNVVDASAINDPMFSHFVEIVEYNPDQVLRYEYGLKPLYYSSKDDIPREVNELKNRVLEVQLMPQLISVLETDEMIADGMEWGTIFIATEKDDILPQLDSNGVGYTEEWVGVQWEQENIR